MNKRIAITYFEPFGGRDTNTSKEVASLLSNYQTIMLPVNWDEVGEVLSKNVSRDTEYLFMLGEAGSYQDVTIELVARNIANGVDNQKVEKQNEIIGGTNLITPIVFNKKELPATYSFNAGKYLCNYSYYFSLKNMKGTKVVFVHLPYPRENLTIEDMKNKVEEIIDYVISNEYRIEIDDYESLDSAFKEIRETVFIKEQKFEYEFDETDYSSIHFLLYLKDNPVATCRLFFDERLVSYHLGRLAVLKDYRHLGVGSTLLLEVEKYLYEMGAKQIILGSQVTACDFYEKNGYKKYGEIYLDEGVEHIYMKKNLC